MDADSTAQKKDYFKLNNTPRRDTQVAEGAALLKL